MHSVAVAVSLEVYCIVSPMMWMKVEDLAPCDVGAVMEQREYRIMSLINKVVQYYDFGRYGLKLRVYAYSTYVLEYGMYGTYCTYRLDSIYRRICICTSRPTTVTPPVTRFACGYSGSYYRCRAPTASYQVYFKFDCFIVEGTYHDAFNFIKLANYNYIQHQIAEYPPPVLLNSTSVTTTITPLCSNPPSPSVP